MNSLPIPIDTRGTRAGFVRRATQRLRPCGAWRQELRIFLSLE